MVKTYVYSQQISSHFNYNNMLKQSVMKYKGFHNHIHIYYSILEYYNIHIILL